MRLNEIIRPITRILEKGCTFGKKAPGNFIIDTIIKEKLAFVDTFTDIF